jgi:hypothetical protein
MNDFIERFNKHDNSHLLKIAESKGEYQPEAVEAAKNILASRRLTALEMETARTEIANEQLEKDRLAQKKIELKNELKDLGTSVADTINPVQEGEPTANKIIKTTTVIFSFLFLYMLYRDYNFLKFVITDANAKWDLSVLTCVLPLVWVPLATFLFYKHLKAGWILLAAYNVYSLTTTIMLIFMELVRQPSSIPMLEHLFPPTSIATFVITLVFFGGSIWLISKSNIREVYRIDGKAMRTTIVITAIATLVLFGTIS